MSTVICPACRVPWSDAEFSSCPACGLGYQAEPAPAPDPRWEPQVTSPPAASQPMPPHQPLEGLGPAASSASGRNEMLVGLAYVGAALGVFLVCSLVQAMAGSSMFAGSFEATNPVMEFLVQITFWPGWLLTIFLAGTGILRIVTSRVSD